MSISALDISNKCSRLALPQLLDIHQPIQTGAIIDAKNDFQAIQRWLEQFTNENTLKLYERESLRFMLWLICINGKHLGELLLDDIKKYVGFLQNPDAGWCMNEKKLKRNNRGWKPFSKPLARKSLAGAVSVLQSLFKFLEESEYITKNPAKLLKIETISKSVMEQKYSTNARMLELDEWQAVLETLKGLPSGTKEETIIKARANMLFSLLYMLGLRISEVASATWLNFKRVDGMWWFFIQGKGGKLGHIPVNDSLMQVVENYRDVHEIKQNLAKDASNIFISMDGNPLSARSLYNLVKTVADAASDKFADKDKKKKLKALSPHWLRHLSASHQSKLGLPITMIKENHRHSSINTTQIYMHTEDAARHAMMQQHDIELDEVPIHVAREYYLSIKLNKGPLDKNRATGIIKNTVQSKILKDAEVVSDNYPELKFKTNSEAPQHAIDNIKMLCKVWLFESTIEQEVL